ncbi:hypothetical protein [Streptomyces sp. NPDC088246]|uniref:hypothetical protein n=1 Tax=Streptomyces sp. NPDC088246 TaxID=3365842 RepID=UPI003814FE91
MPNPVTGKPTPGRKYAASTRAHSETVPRGFYALHLDRGTDTVLVNPFPLDRSRRGSRAHERHNPMDAFAPTRTGRYRPKVPKRIPDDKFNEISTGLRSNRDRALLASWVSARRPGGRTPRLGGARRPAGPAADRRQPQQAAGGVDRGVGDLLGQASLARQGGHCASPPRWPLPLVRRRRSSWS